MKLGILIYSLAGGGAERVVSYLVNYCYNNNIEVHLILMNKNRTYQIPDGVSIHYLEQSKENEPGILKALKIPLLAIKYAKLVSKLKLTHSASFLTRPCFINILSRNFTSHKFNIIINERAYPSLQYGYKGLQSFFNKKMIKSLYKKADLLIANSIGNAQDLIENFEFPQNKVKIINNPIDLDKINAIEPIKDFFDKSKFNTISIGRLDEGKNHLMLIKTIYKLKNPNVRLYIFGEGILRKQLEESITKLNLQDQVFLMGFDPNPYKYLKSCDLFIFGSNHEGFPNVLLEAMACRLPILTTNCKSGPSEIMKLTAEKDDLMITDYGILVPVNNSSLMAKGLKYFLNNTSFNEKCRQNSEKRIIDFEKNNILRRYIETVKYDSKSQPKIAFLIYSLSGGGAERQLSYVLSYCTKNKIEAHLVLMNSTIQYKIPENTEIHFLEKSNSNENGLIKALKIPLIAYKYSRLLKSLSITHSVSMLTRPNFINILAQRLTRHKFKVITNELAYPTLQYSYKGFQSKFNKLFIKRLYKKSDLIICNSIGNSKDLIDNFFVPKDKIAVVHNPIDIEKIKIIDPIENFFDSKYFDLITLGRLEVGKNHEMLIRAVQKLNNPYVRLYIFGEGPLKDHLENLINELNLNEQVYLMGFDKNPFKYLKSADLFVFGSNHEGFPNVILEAMACNLSILSTNCKSGPAEIMKLENVVNDIMITDLGILTPIKNIDIMTKGISYFLNNKSYSAKCRANGLNRIMDFEKKKILTEYVSIILNAK